MDHRFRTARPGERWVVRRRLPDESATDLIGWLDDVGDDHVRMSPAAGIEPVTVPYGEVIAARRAPAAAGGPPPSRTSAAGLERLAMTAWVAEHEQLGEWTLRAGGGFTGRANSCLAVGDPGVPIAEAAERIVSYARDHGSRPWAQVIIGSAEDEALSGLGWQRTYVETEVLTVRLADLLGTELPDPTVVVDERPDTFWSAYATSRPYDVDPDTVRKIIDGVPPRAYGTVTLDRLVVAIGRGHLSGDWLGLMAIWTRPGHRRRGRATKIMIALGHWAARRGARYAYLQVASENTGAIRTYEQLGFVRHHRYRYLAAP